MKNSELIKSHTQLKQLCLLLQWANASDADETTDRPAVYARQRTEFGFGFYGHIWEAIKTITWEEAGIDISLPDPNFGGNATWYDALIQAIDTSPVS